MKVALITGSKGYIGRNLMDFLPQHKIQVRGFDLSLGQDILNPDQVKKAIHGCDIIYNCAAITNQQECERDRDRAFKINIEGTRLVVELAHKLNVKPILFSSDIILGNTFYGKIKKQMEVENQEKSVILRLTNVCGALGYEEKRNVLWHFNHDDPIIIHRTAGTCDFIPMQLVLEKCLEAIRLSYGIYDVESGFKIPINVLAYVFGAARGVSVEKR